MADIYRKSSIEKLSNPEQLDRAIIISSPMSWIALIGIFGIIVAVVIWSFKGSLPTTVEVSGVIVSPDNSCAIYSDTAGTITKVLKKSGDKVKTGDDIAKVKTTVGKEIVIEASQDGVLTDLLVESETTIYAGAEIARYTPDISDEQIVVCYVPVQLANKMGTDMKVLLFPYSVDSQESGHMEATIVSVSEYAVSTNNMWYVLGNGNLISEQFLANGPVVSVVCKIKMDDSTDSGFYWSSDNGKDVVIPNGEFLSAKIVTDECAPITKLIRNLKEKLEG